MQKVVRWGISLQQAWKRQGWQDIVEKLNEADEALKNEQSDVGVTPVMSAAFAKKTGKEILKVFLRAFNIPIASRNLVKIITFLKDIVESALKSCIK